MLLLCLTLCNPWTAAWQTSLPFTISWSLLKLMYIESVMRAMNSHIFLVYMAKNNKTGYDTPLVHKNSRYIFLILERKSLMISSKKNQYVN